MKHVKFSAAAVSSRRPGERRTARHFYHRLSQEPTAKMYTIQHSAPDFCRAELMAGEENMYVLAPNFRRPHLVERSGARSLFFAIGKTVS